MCMTGQWLRQATYGTGVSPRVNGTTQLIIDSALQMYTLTLVVLNSS